MKSPRTDGLTWHGPWDFLEAGPFRVASALAYTAPGAHSLEPSAILLDAPLHTLNRPQLMARRHQLRAFYRSYEAMGAPDRWEYLHWLEQGRPAGASQCFFYIHLQGLERRALAEGQDLLIVWNELWRVLEGNQSDEFALQYETSCLLWFLLAGAPEIVPEDHVQRLSQRLRPLNPYDDNEAQRRISLVVWWCSQKLGGLPPWMAYHVARTSAEARHSAVSYRTGPEIEALFEARVGEIVQTGLPIHLPERASTTLSYHPVNSSLERSRKSWPDPLRGAGWDDLEAELVRLLVRCQSDLRPLGVYLGREGSTRESAAAWELTPRELRLAEHPARKLMMELISERIRDHHWGRVPLGTLAEIFEVPEREGISPSTAKRLAASIQFCGFGVEPDARLTGKAPQWTDEVILFAAGAEPGTAAAMGLDTAEATDEQIARYRASAYVCRLALYVTQFHESVLANALEDTTARLATILGWSNFERLRYIALCANSLEAGVEPAQLRTSAVLPLRVKEQLGELLVDLAVGEGRMGPEQEKALLFAWKRLGLPARRLQDHLGALSARGIIFVGALIASGRGERLPAGPPLSHPHPELKLDHALIAALLKDTQHVQATLREAMAVEEEAAGVAPAASPVAVPPLHPAEDVPPEFSTLPARFHPFLSALLRQDQWNAREAHELARAHGVMLSGAVEAVNEWAFDEFGTQLIWDDGENLTIERALIQY